MLSCLFLTGGSLTKLAYYSTVQHKVAKVRSFDHTGKASEFCMNINPYRFYIGTVLLMWAGLQFET